MNAHRICTNWLRVLYVNPSRRGLITRLAACKFGNAVERVPNCPPIRAGRASGLCRYAASVILAFNLGQVGNTSFGQVFLGADNAVRQRNQSGFAMRNMIPAGGDCIGVTVSQWGKTANDTFYFIPKQAKPSLAVVPLAQFVSYKASYRTAERRAEEDRKSVV